MANSYCDTDSESFPKWTFWQAVRSRLAGVWYGRYEPDLVSYKSSWIAFNRLRILSIATENQIPPDLLGTVAFNELGGDPPVVKRTVLGVRQFDRSGPNWVSNHLTTTKPPMDTSEGAIKIQLRNAAEVMGIDGRKMSFSQQSQLTQCLEIDVYNLRAVAQLLRKLILYDYPSANTQDLTNEQFIIAGSRYNRGTARKLSDLQQSLRDPVGSPTRQYTEYGRSMIRHRALVRNLLQLAPVEASPEYVP